MSAPNKEKKSLSLMGMFRNRCPHCGKGHLYVKKSVFPLSKCLKMHKHCKICGKQLIYETNNGPGINYALTVIIFFINVLWYWPLFGLSYKDNSVYYFLASSIVVVLVLQPWLMRFSRSVYLYIMMMFRED